MITYDFSKEIEELRRKETRLLQTAEKTLRRHLNDLADWHAKVISGAEDLSTLEEQLGGIEAIAKRGRGYLRSVRALAEFSKSVLSKFEEITPPDKSDETYFLFETFPPEYDEIKNYYQNMSRLIATLEKEQRSATQTMGLDFLIKKRTLMSPFGKVVHTRNALRELLTNDYRIVKTMEDLERINTESNDLHTKYQNIIKEKEQLQQDIDELVIKIEELENIIEKTEEEGKLKELRNERISHQELILKIGRIINPLKKAFKIIRDDFNAQMFESETVNTFLEDSANNFEMLSSLMNKLENHPQAAKAKGNIKGRITSIRSGISEGRFIKLKEEYYEGKKRIDELEKVPEIIQKEKAIEEKKHEITLIASRLSENEELKEKLERDIEEKISEIENRTTRMEKILNEAQNK